MTVLRRGTPFVVAHDPARGRWVKSSLSGLSGTSCVEVADGGRDVAVRDSKNRLAELTFLPTTWVTFLGTLHAG